MKTYMIFLLFTITIFPVQIKARPAGNDTNYTKPTGSLIDIGGYRLHLNCSGAGDLTVVLISGSANFSFDWILVQNELSKSEKVCSYDRPNLAWSDPGPLPQTFVQDAYELHKLLHNAGVKLPLVLVGHSAGGIIARMYTKQYPDDVAGMVLLDATSENAILNVKGKIERVRLLASHERKIPPVKIAVDSLTRVPDIKDVEALWNMFGKPSVSYPFNLLPSGIQKTRLWALSQPKYQIADSYEYMPEEFAKMFSDSLKNNMGSKPLLILYSSKNEYPEELGALRDSLMNDKIKNQMNFLKLSGNSKIISTGNSGHEIFLTEPNLVVDVIKQVIISAKTKSVF